MWAAKAINILNRLKYQALSGTLLLGLSFNGMVFGVDKNSSDLLHTYSSKVSVQELQVPAESLKQYVRVQVFLPHGYAYNGSTRYPSLYINDGQDSEALGIQQTLNALYAEKRIEPVIVVAVSMLPDRMNTYGYSDREAKRSLIANTKYGPVGTQAQDYSDWLAHTLVPTIDRQFRTETTARSRSILGWSLGAANAFNIAWNYPDVFSRVGGFSPSFFLSATAGDPSTSIVQAVLASKPLPEYFTVWLAVGDKEETDDRDADGVIDVVDDAQAVIDALNAKTPSVKKNKGRTKFQLRTYKDGQHNQASWKVMLPDFLQWAYPVVPP